MRLLPAILISSCLLALVSAEADSYAQAKMMELFESPDMESFVDYLRNLATKRHAVTLPEDEKAVFNSCQTCVTAFGAFVNLYDALSTLGVEQDAFNEALKVG